MFFDAHCDTVSRAFTNQGALLSEGEHHVSLSGLRRANVRAQVFAVWAWTGRYPGQEYETALAMIDTLLAACRSSPQELRLADCGSQVAGAFSAPGPRAVIAALEGTDALQGQAERIEEFHRRGVRVLTLAWGDSPFAGSASGSGAGLSESGVELVGRCEELGIALDCSHLSDRAFADLCGAARKPFLASHSSCRSLCPNPRNLSDDMIRELARRGGVVGINLGASFLSAAFAAQARATGGTYLAALAGGGETGDPLAGRRAQLAALPRPSLALFAEHVRHAIVVGGEDCVGIGGDLDGVLCLPEGIDGVGDYERLARALRAAGLPARQVEKVCYGNMLRFFEHVLPPGPATPCQVAMPRPGP